MVRNYISRKRGTRTYKNFNEDQMEAAIKLIESKKMTYRQVEEEFKISRSTLCLRMKKKSLSNQGVSVPGHPTALTWEEEEVIAEHLVVVALWGFPFNKLDLRFLVKASLDSMGRVVRQFKDNMPGDDWAISFLRRHSEMLSSRLGQNISRKRAQVQIDEINDYFHNLQQSLEGVPPEQILNYDETNLSDDPGRQTFIFKRGTKYPERIINSSKSAISVMFAGSASGELLPPYTVYKARCMWESWKEGGPPGARYNHTISGWFDEVCFSDWFHSIVVPWAQKYHGRKVIIGDNLSSHFSKPVLNTCEELNISFVCLPPNSTHLLQPLDVAFYGPLKKYWREILRDWKLKAGRKFTTLPKDKFPSLLSTLLEKIKPSCTSNENSRAKTNLMAGFRTCGIFPLDSNTVLKKLPGGGQDCISPSVSKNVIDLLKNLRNDAQPIRAKRRKRVNVVPGKSVAAQDLVANEEADGQQSHAVSHRCKKLRAEPSTSEVPINDIPAAASKIHLSKPGMGSRCTGPIGTSTNDVLLTGSYSAGDWVIVQYSTLTGKDLKSYAGQIIKINENGTLKVTFLRHVAENRFRWADPSDIDDVEETQVFRDLSKPSICKKNDRVISIIFPNQFKNLKLC